MSSVALQRLFVSYNGKPAVRDLSLDVAEGSWIALIGPNGAGKTTVLRAIAGVVEFSGRIDVGGDTVGTISRRHLARLVAYVPQRPVMPSAATVIDYVLMGRNPFISYFGTEGKEDLDVVANVLERLELTEFAARPLASLSGGEGQRAVLARALAQQAPVLLLDEPTSALDVGHQQQVLELIDALRIEQRLTVITTMHDLTLAGQYSESFLMLHEGAQVAAGSANDVLREDLISRYYGASVEVLKSSSGLRVVPTRPERQVER